MPPRCGRGRGGLSTAAPSSHQNSAYNSVGNTPPSDAVDLPMDDTASVAESMRSGAASACPSCFGAAPPLRGFSVDTVVSPSLDLAIEQITSLPPSDREA